MLHEARTGHIRPLRARATMRSRQPPYVTLPLPVWARKGARGKGRARQPCAAAPGRKTLHTPPIAEGQRIPCLPTVLISNDPVPIVWNAIAEPH